MATNRSEVSLVVRRVEGALVRVIGTTVRRGFEPVAVSSRLARDNTFRVSMTVEGARSVEGLARHLANLYDVIVVDVSELAT